MENILEIFIKVANNEGVTITALESIIGASKGVLSRAVAKNTDIQAKWLLKLVEKYPLYNPEWLLTGKGEMMQKDTKERISPEVTAPQGVVAIYEKWLADKDRIIEEQKRELLDIHKELGRLEAENMAMKEALVQRAGGGASNAGEQGSDRAAS